MKLEAVKAKVCQKSGLIMKHRCNQSFHLSANLPSKDTPQPPESSSGYSSMPALSSSGRGSPTPTIPEESEKTIVVLGPKQKTKSKICTLIKNTISYDGKQYWKGNQDIPIKIVEAENDFHEMSKQLQSLKEIHIFFIDVGEPDYKIFHQYLRLLKACYGEKFLSNTVINLGFDHMQKNVEVRREFYKRFQNYSQKIKEVPIVFLRTDIEQKSDEEAKELEKELRMIESQLQKNRPLIHDGINDLKLLFQLMQEELDVSTFLQSRS